MELAENHGFPTQMRQKVWNMDWLDVVDPYLARALWDTGARVGYAIFVTYMVCTVHVASKMRCAQSKLPDVCKDACKTGSQAHTF